MIVTKSKISEGENYQNTFIFISEYLFNTFKKYISLEEFVALSFKEDYILMTQSVTLKKILKRQVIDDTFQF